MKKENEVVGVDEERKWARMYFTCYEGDMQF
jgi:hypothetical protein